MGNDPGAQAARRVISTIITCCLLLFAIAVILSIGVTVFLVLWFTHSAGLNPETSEEMSYSSAPTRTPSRSATVSFSSSLSTTASPSLTASSSTTPSLSRPPSLTPSTSLSTSTTPSNSNSQSITPTISITPSNTGSISVTPSASQSRPSTTSTASLTASISITGSTTPSRSISNSPSTTISISPSKSPQPITVELSTLTSASGYVIYGAVQNDNSGGTVNLVGDMNGDGLPDWIIGTKGSSPSGSGTGYAHLVYAKPGLASIDLQTLGTQGVAISNAGNNAFSFLSVASAGDFNRDGYSDLIIGAEGANPLTGRDAAGEGYIVYGKAGGLSAVNLANLGTGGIKLYGSVGSDFSHNSVDGGQDLDGDGITDILIGAWKAQVNQKGQMYVLYGSATQPSTIDFNTTTNGYTIRGPHDTDYCGSAVSFAGDFNNDGVKDAIMGCSFFNNQKGGAYVIYGGAKTTTSVNATQVTAASLFVGKEVFDKLGSSVSNIGDFNGDGVDDIVVGAPGASGAGGNRYQSGIAYVIYGKPGGYGTAAIEASTLSNASAVQIWGKNQADYTAASVSWAGDVNGDGLQDIIIGSPLRNSGAGAAYIIFGRRGGYSSIGGVIDILYLTADAGITINGASGDGLGISVGPAGDVNGDGYADVLIGASKASPKGRTNAGQTYVIYGKAY